MPLTELRFRCSQCGTDRTDFVVASRDNPPQPWLERLTGRIAAGRSAVSR
jgi:hypothetical protein